MKAAMHASFSSWPKNIPKIEVALEAAAAMDELDERQWKERCHLVMCQFCRTAEVYCPDILLCEECFNSGATLVRKLKEAWHRNREAGSVRPVSGGLPSLGKRR